MNPLEMIGLTEARRGELNLEWYAVRNEQDTPTWAEYLALAGMRALEKWRKGRCTKKGHHGWNGYCCDARGTVVYQAECRDCCAELRAALEARHE